MFKVKSTVNVNISIYTVTGELVVTIVDEIHEPEIYTREWILTNSEKKQLNILIGR